MLMEEKKEGGKPCVRRREKEGKDWREKMTQYTIGSKGGGKNLRPFSIPDRWRVTKLVLAALWQMGKCEFPFGSG